MTGEHDNDKARAPSALASRLSELLDLQHGLLTALDDLSRRQIALIDTDDGERLLQVVGQRQQVIDRVLEAGKLLEPLRAEWNRGADAIPADDRDAVRRRIDAVTRLMDAIAARDEEARRRLVRRRDLLAAEMAGVDRGRTAVAAYAEPARPHAPRFQDREA
jgi:hypothetical protein